MADWQKRSKILGDVVEFDYVNPGLAQNSSFVYVWDLDKTYLDSSFGTFKELWRTIREKAFQKKNIPGSKILVQALTEQQEGKQFALYFITASPPQLEEKIKAKLVLDKIHPFGAYFKDNLKNLRPSRMWRLMEQVGYKLQALLELRRKLKADVQQIMWGDDSESDAIIYSLYSDICSRRIQDDDLRSTLEGLNVLPPQIETIFKLQDEIPIHDPVFKIYINLISDTDPDYYLKFGKRLLPTYNMFQIALDLFQDRRIEMVTLQNIAFDLITNYEFTIDELLWSYEDMVQRGYLKSATIDEITLSLKESKILPLHFTLSNKTLSALQGPELPLDWVPGKIDYLNDYR